MAVPLVPRLYIVVAASVVVCTVFFLWIPFQPATVSKILNYTSGIKAVNLESIRNETLGVHSKSAFFNWKMLTAEFSSRRS